MDNRLNDNLTYSDEFMRSIPDDLFRESTSNPDETFDAQNVGFESYWYSVFHQFLKKKAAVFFLIVMVILIVFAFIQPLLPGQMNPKTIHNNPDTGLPLMNHRPDGIFVLGTNSLGQDIWARLWQGTRISLFIGFSVAFLRSLLGIVIGMVWGYVRKLDLVFTEIYNIIDNIPSTIILIVASYLIKPGVLTMIFAMCLTGWIGSARFVRNQVVIIREKEYNNASQCLGTPLYKILFRNIFPHILPIVLMQMAGAVPAAIGNEVFVTYLGLGLPLDVPSLGNLLNSGRALIMSPSLRYQFYAPAVILSLITVGFYVIGRALADVSNPKNQ